MTWPVLMKHVVLGGYLHTMWHFKLLHLNFKFLCMNVSVWCCTVHEVTYSVLWEIYLCTCIYVLVTYIINNVSGWVLSSRHTSFSPENGISFWDDKFCSEYQMMDKIQTSYNMKYFSSCIDLYEGEIFYTFLKNSFYVIHILHWIKW